MNIILLGAPGSGKGTIAKLISGDFGIPHISTGNIFRENIVNNTELGTQTKEIISNGELVPDDITIKIVENRLKEDDCKEGFILDGFPRNIIQAKALEKFVNIDKIIFLDVPYEDIENRMSKRLTCKDCGEIYSSEVYSNEKCSKCGGILVKREDDTLETFRKRFEIYEKQTAPLIDFYQGKIFRVDGSVSPQDAYESVKIELSIIS